MLAPPSASSSVLIDAATPIRLVGTSSRMLARYGEYAIPELICMNSHTTSRLLYVSGVASAIRATGMQTQAHSM